LNERRDVQQIEAEYLPLPFVGRIAFRVLGNERLKIDQFLLFRKLAGQRQRGA
jgi:hypothetical protein